MFIFDKKYIISQQISKKISLYDYNIDDNIIFKFKILDIGCIQIC